MIPASKLAEWRAATEKATPGPWGVTRIPGDPFDVDRLCVVVDADDQQVADCFDNTPGHRSDTDCAANARLCALAREAVPALLDEREALRAQVDRLRDHVHAAWGIIANAGGGNWSLESQDWQDAAARWRLADAALGRAVDVSVAADSPPLHCWEDGPRSDDDVGSTCMLPDGHAGEHEFTRDDGIGVSFAEAKP